MRFISEGSFLEIGEGRNFEEGNLVFKNIRSKTKWIIAIAKRVVGNVDNVIQPAQTIIK